ncbi:hypothetical protein [Calidithermus chliarophilus]|uniref:hypothetical protein n=1 Tax=Calidithermus chliarophilus TaxID=52023 RepID=UPI00041C1BEB|nr:hypothetical protein [Calidithermus chliarophilus]
MRELPDLRTLDGLGRSRGTGGGSGPYQGPLLAFDAFGQGVPLGGVGGSVAGDGLSAPLALRLVSEPLPSTEVAHSSLILRPLPEEVTGHQSVAWALPDGSPFARPADKLLVGYLQLTAPDPQGNPVKLGFFATPDPAPDDPGIASVELTPSGPAHTWRVTRGGALVGMEFEHNQLEVGFMFVLLPGGGHLILAGGLQGAKYLEPLPRLQPIAYDPQSQGGGYLVVRSGGRGAGQVWRAAVSAVEAQQAGWLAAPFAQLHDPFTGQGEEVPGSLSEPWVRDPLGLRVAAPGQGWARMDFATPDPVRLLRFTQENGTPGRAVQWLIGDRFGGNMAVLELDPEWPRIYLALYENGQQTDFVTAGPYAPQQGGANTFEAVVTAYGLELYRDGERILRHVLPQLHPAFNTPGLTLYMAGPTGSYSYVRDFAAWCGPMVQRAGIDPAEPFQGLSTSSSLYEGFEGSGPLGAPWQRVSGPVGVEYVQSGGEGQPSGPVNGLVSLRYAQPLPAFTRRALLEGHFTPGPSTFDPDNSFFQGLDLANAVTAFLFAQGTEQGGNPDAGQGPESTEVEVTFGDSGPIRYRQNLRDRIKAGQSYALGLLSDGDRFTVWIDGEPVLCGSRSAQGFGPAVLDTAGFVARDGDSGEGRIDSWSAQAELPGAGELPT